MLFRKNPYRGTFVRSLFVVLCLGAIPALAAAAPQEAPAVTQSVVTQQDLQQAMAGKAAVRDADRAAIRGLLERPEVQNVATRAGLDVNRALDKVSTLSDQDLSSLAARARTIDARIAGGDDVVIISTTGALVILLIILLVV